MDIERWIIEPVTYVSMLGIFLVSCGLGTDGHVVCFSEGGCLQYRPPKELAVSASTFSHFLH